MVQTKCLCWSYALSYALRSFLELKSRIKALDLENPKMVLENGMYRPEPGIFM